MFQAAMVTTNPTPCQSARIALTGNRMKSSTILTENGLGTRKTAMKRNRQKNMRNIMSSIVVTLALCAAVAGCTSRKAKTEPADYMFSNAKVYTVNPDQQWAEAIAVRGNEIVYVGDTAGARAFEGKKTQIFDLDGKMVLPGFVSGHDHLIASNWTKAGVDLFSAKSKDDYLRMIREYAEAHPDDEIVFGFGWDRTNYGGYPTARELDAAVLDRPAMIFDFTICG